MELRLFAEFDDASVARQAHAELERRGYMRLEIFSPFPLEEATRSRGTSRLGAVAFVAAFLAGAINSVAGGGTLVSFPALIWLGLDSVTANATSTVAIWPGTVGSIWGYRRELRDAMTSVAETGSRRPKSGSRHSASTTNVPRRWH